MMDPRCAGRAQAQSDHQRVVELDVRVGVEDVLRMMGCRNGEKVSPDVRQLAMELLRQAPARIHPRCVYAVRNVERMTDTELQLEGSPAIHGPIAAFLKPSTRVVTFVLTIGSEVERLASERMTGGRSLEGFVWHAIGSAAADYAVDVLTEHLLHEEAGPEEAVTPPFSPGYCGLGMDQQKALFTIVDGAAVGVKLWPTMCMEPIKSVSGLMGIGPRDQVTERGVPCEYCDLDDCSMRRG